MRFDTGLQTWTSDDCDQSLLDGNLLQCSCISDTPVLLLGTFMNLTTLTIDQTPDSKPVLPVTPNNQDNNSSTTKTNDTTIDQDDDDERSSIEEII